MRNQEFLKHLEAHPEGFPVRKGDPTIPQRAVHYGTAIGYTRKGPSAYYAKVQIPNSTRTEEWHLTHVFLDEQSAHKKQLA
jgi:hypothetical protein